MILNKLESWAVDLKDVGAIYPMQGWEVPMAIVGIALWLGWHVWQLGTEKRNYRDKAAKHGTAENLKRAVDSD